ncbi:endolytic transglycosylase MltG [Fodinisporobacter ferrooxydans]|uniref:Endolytic murein transglycosylase n=1 Tax=Fodinisporobacter ferrooxydans TaxID=2901836 RepID=A0ABY4CI61_9BACL|nr:endolytic transglycosylase MltG [Alicyclobacillaceae bacterium MYW30-H2]
MSKHPTYTSSLRKKTKFLLGICLLLIIGIAFWLYWMMQPVQGQTERSIDIPSGASSQQIGNILYTNRLIHSPIAFRIYLTFLGDEGKLQAGHYHLKQGQTLGQMIHTMVSGDKSAGTIRFTVPEGYTIDQIADLLQKDGIVSAQAFLNEADHGTFTEPFVKEIPANSAYHHRLEGYLFPDTYEIFKGSTAHEIIDKMLQRMQQEFTSRMIADVKNSGYTVHQVLTIASMVEREAKVDKERPIIAGVMYNRLHQKPPMPLQIDATIEYVLNNKFPLTGRDLEVDSPYNTYLHTGLPPGPIASPGIKSIMAAIHPDHNDYLYYVTRNDGSGTHYFSKTYAEQLQNEQKSERNAAQAPSAAH